MQRPTNWDSIPAQTFSGNEYPPAGTYVFRIVSESHDPSKQGKEMITLSLDIAEGQFKGYYRKLSDSTGKDRMLKHYRSITDESMPYFKGDIKAIEESNAGFTYNFSDGSLRDKFVGGMLREEEYLANSGETKTINKIMFLCSAEKARSGALKIPLIKKLNLTFPPSEKKNNYSNEPLPWDK
jgi:hypothetical protein